MSFIYQTFGNIFTVECIQFFVEYFKFNLLSEDQNHFIVDVIGDQWGPLKKKNVHAGGPKFAVGKLVPRTKISGIKISLAGQIRHAIPLLMGFYGPPLDESNSAQIRALAYMYRMLAKVSRRNISFITSWHARLGPPPRPKMYYTV